MKFIIVTTSLLATVLARPLHRSTQTAVGPTFEELTTVQMEAMMTFRGYLNLKKVISKEERAHMLRNTGIVHWSEFHVAMGTEKFREPTRIKDYFEKKLALSGNEPRFVILHLVSPHSLLESRIISFNDWLNVSTVLDKRFQGFLQIEEYVCDNFELFDRRQSRRTLGLVDTNKALIHTFSTDKMSAERLFRETDTIFRNTVRQLSSESEVMTFCDEVDKEVEWKTALILNSCPPDRRAPAYLQMVAKHFENFILTGFICDSADLNSLNFKTPAFKFDKNKFQNGTLVLLDFSLRIGCLLEYGRYPGESMLIADVIEWIIFVHNQGVILDLVLFIIYHIPLTIWNIGWYSRPLSWTKNFIFFYLALYHFTVFKAMLYFCGLHENVYFNLWRLLREYSLHVQYIIANSYLIYIFISGLNAYVLFINATHRSNNRADDTGGGNWYRLRVGEDGQLTTEVLAMEENERITRIFTHLSSPSNPRATSAEREEQFNDLCCSGNSVMWENFVTENDDSSEDICAICLEKPEMKDIIFKMPQCTHWLHLYCMKMMYVEKGYTICPTCRVEIYSK